MSRRFPQLRQDQLNAEQKPLADQVMKVSSVGIGGPYNLLLRSPVLGQRMFDLFEYGNRNIGGGIDQFWLTGDLRIDPVQQVDFLDRLRRGVLPISKRSQDLVRDILPVTQVGDAIIRAKSGLLGAERGQPSLGWMVGWAEKGEARAVFALNMDCKETRHIADRMNLTQACLRDIGAI